MSLLSIGLVRSWRQNPTDPYCEAKRSPSPTVTSSTGAQTGTRTSSWSSWPTIQVKMTTGSTTYGAQFNQPSQSNNNNPLPMYLDATLLKELIEEALYTFSNYPIPVSCSMLIRVITFKIDNI